MTVLRNQYEPVFSFNYYNTTVDEVTSYDTNILKVEAVDKDHELQSGVSYLSQKKFLSMIDQ